MFPIFDERLDDDGLVFRVPGSRLRVSGFGFRIESLGFKPAPGSGFQMPCSRFRIQDSGCRVPDSHAGARRVVAVLDESLDDDVRVEEHQRLLQLPRHRDVLPSLPV